MIAPHATPAAAYAALGEFLTEDAPELISATIDKQYEAPPTGAAIVTYSAEIHVYVPHFSAWLEHFELAESDVERSHRNDEKDTLTIATSGGVTIFTIADKITDGGAA